MPERQWFMDEEFDVPLPEWVADECAQFYGTGRIGIDFAQGLATFLHAKHLKLIGDKEERDDGRS